MLQSGGREGRDRIVQDAVKAPQLLLDAGRHGDELRIFRLFQVQREYCRLGLPVRDNLVIDRFQRLNFPPQQDHGGAVGCECAGGGAADAAPGAGDENHALLQQIPRRLILAEIGNVQMQ